MDNMVVLQQKRIDNEGRRYAIHQEDGTWHNCREWYTLTGLTFNNNVNARKGYLIIKKCVVKYVQHFIDDEYHLSTYINGVQVVAKAHTEKYALRRLKHKLWALLRNRVRPDVAWNIKDDEKYYKEFYKYNKNSEYSIEYIIVFGKLLQYIKMEEHVYTSIWCKQYKAKTINQLLVDLVNARIIGDGYANKNGASNG